MLFKILAIAIVLYFIWAIISRVLHVFARFGDHVERMNRGAQDFRYDPGSVSHRRDHSVKDITERARIIEEKSDTSDN